MRSIVLLLAIATRGQLAVAEDKAPDQAASMESYAIKLHASEVRDVANLKLESGGLRIETGAVTVVPISSKRA